MVQCGCVCVCITENKKQRTSSRLQEELAACLVVKHAIGHVLVVTNLFHGQWIFEDMPKFPYSI